MSRSPQIRRDGGNCRHSGVDWSCGREGMGKTGFRSHAMMGGWQILEAQR